nr:MAG TPA: hypothetical protein [Caudoviricetes sp.]
MLCGGSGKGAAGAGPVFGHLYPVPYCQNRAARRGDSEL